MNDLITAYGIAEEKRIGAEVAANRQRTRAMLLEKKIKGLSDKDLEEARQRKSLEKGIHKIKDRGFSR